MWGGRKKEVMRNITTALGNYGKGGELGKRVFARCVGQVEQRDTRHACWRRLNRRLEEPFVLNIGIFYGHIACWRYIVRVCDGWGPQLYCANGDFFLCLCCKKQIKQKSRLSVLWSSGVNIPASALC